MSLRELTQTKHEELEAMPFTHYMLSGNISNEDYAKFLYQMIHLYQAMEEVASNLNILDDMPDLPRYYFIKHDYEELVGESIKHPLLPATKEYCDYIREIKDPVKIVAHMYVRYTSDLLNGQKIKKLVPSSGSFYDFKNVKELTAKFKSKLSDEMLDDAIMSFNFNIAISRQLEETRIFS